MCLIFFTCNVVAALFLSSYFNILPLSVQTTRTHFRHTVSLSVSYRFAVGVGHLLFLFIGRYCATCFDVVIMCNTMETRIKDLYIFLFTSWKLLRSVQFYIRSIIFILLNNLSHLQLFQKDQSKIFVFIYYRFVLYFVKL